MTTTILTYGCRLNAFESEVIRGHTAHLRDTIVVNTCAVTQEAEHQARKSIARAHRERPGARIVVTGCAAQINPAAWAALPGVTRVLGNLEKLRAGSWAENAPAAHSDIMAASGMKATPVTEFAGRARAFVAIQQGCDHRCTFCIIPYGRGPSRSVPLGQLAGQVRALLAAGYQEIVLTGVDILSYGPDLPARPTLAATLRRLLALVPGLPRLRLSSLDPAAFDDSLMDLIASEPRLMPHIHLSLQAASDLILKRMKRRHSVDDAARLIARLRAVRPGIAIGADVICGFPTETDALFEETRRFIASHQLPYLHVFPYSPRPGTPAARMPQVAPAIRRARAAILREEGARNAHAFHTRAIGRLEPVLVEAGNRGHTPHFAPVRFVHAAPFRQIIETRLTALQDGMLLAEAA